ncbi:MAG: hypothetical protein JW891_11835 [Candidatus Lokiarchaeota archaeon]|nr:hypothetical protein [Candidatus Lokiarchaeota archaeon]
MIWIPLLLSDPSPCLRVMVLKNLLDRDEKDSEVKELLNFRNEDPLIINLLQLQASNGGWDTFGSKIISSGDSIYTTSLALQRLGYLGFGSENPSVQKAAEFLFSNQQKDGSWPMPGKKQREDEELGYQKMPVQTAIPLLGLVMCGYAKDKRAEKAFNWLNELRLEDGAWPVGISAGNYGGIAGYRRISHSRWGCRSNTLAVLSCLAYHPQKRKSNIARQALDLLLGTDMKQRSSLGFFVARILGLERSIGRITFMARFDIAHLLNLCWRIGASIDDERVSEFVEFIKGEQGPFGMWDYSSQPKATRWITYDLLNSLKQIDINKEWFSLEPRTPFQSYDTRKRIY